MWTYRATCEAWIDGDTLVAVVDLGFYTLRRERLRLMGSAGGVDTPEMNSRNPAERARAQAAKARVLELLPPGTGCTIQTARAAAGDPKDGFGRFLAQVTLPDGRNLGDVLLAEGLAVPYAR